MGYTHYWTIKGKIQHGDKETMLTNMKKVVKKYNKILQLTYEDSHKPIVDDHSVQFNGIGDDSHEDFVLEFPDRDFCKTARKPYDIAVCECLLIAKAHYDKHMELSSDGFWGDELDESWPEAMKNVNAMGYNVKGMKINDSNKWCVEVF